MWVPFNLKRDGSNPAIVLPHGGPTWQITDYFNRTVIALVTRGYICIAPGDPEKDRAIYDADSPLTYIKNAKAPLLVLQGDNDIRVPREEADRQRFRRAGEWTVERRLPATSLESGMHNAMPCPASTSMRIEPKVSHSTAMRGFMPVGAKMRLRYLR
jgi:hypothetical protein